MQSLTAHNADMRLPLHGSMRHSIRYYDSDHEQGGSLWGQYASPYTCFEEILQKLCLAKR